MVCPFCNAARELVAAEREVIEARALLARAMLDLLPMWEQSIALQREMLDSLRLTLTQIATTADDVARRGRVQ